MRSCSIGSDQMADTGLAIQLIEAGTLEDFTGGDKTALDRELEQIQSSNQVDRVLDR